MDDRAARQNALAEKKRRLEEIKARRRQPPSSVVVDDNDGGDGSSSSTTTNSNNNLDSYIDDLLKSKTPGSLAAATAVTTSYDDDDTDTAAAAAAVAAVDHPPSSSTPPTRATNNDGVKSSFSENEKYSDNGGVIAAPTRTVETYEIAIQCCAEEDIPPPVLVEEDEEDEDDDDEYDDDSKEGVDDDNDDNDNNIDGTSSMQNKAKNDSSSSGELPSSPSQEQTSATIVSLSHDQRSKVLSSKSFARFISDAGRRVERLLGSTDDDNSSLRDLLRSAATASITDTTTATTATATGGSMIDYGVDYANDNDDYDDDDDDGDDVVIGGGPRQRHKKHNTNSHDNMSPTEAYRNGGHLTACVTYEFPRFTKGRCITDIEWCPGHGEWLVASYGSTSSSSLDGDVDGESGTTIASSTPHNPATRKLSPNDLPSSSSLNYFASSSIPDEGIVAIYNLSMPGRPEHVFCAGCPILTCCFHPTEGPRLVVGGASSGQVLVWDARAGRYPVQRSGSSSGGGGGGGGGGHDRELVGMRIIGGEGGAMAASMLVTASSDGKVNYWSASNLREPVEHVNIDANLSCLDLLQGVTEGLVCGDERGGVHAVLPGTGRDGTGSNKRSVRMLHPGASLQLSNVVMEDGSGAADGVSDMGHYGMVTGIATRNEVPAIRTPRGVGNSTTMPIITSKGFSRGLGGLVITTGVDWSTKLWAPAHHDGPLTSFLSNSYDYMCDVQWSPVHPSIFATASSNGTMNIWNLASTIDQPINGTEGIPISGSDTGGDSPHQGLNRLQWSSDGRRLAVASGDKLHVLGVGEHVWKAKGNEEGKVMSNLISRGFIQQE